eukprot:Hpha_TRINITY_DN35496_c0_g1::TRINITY_DN35496_c0_g1_i1::g.83384::m.83384
MPARITLFSATAVAALAAFFPVASGVVDHLKDRVPLTTTVTVVDIFVDPTAPTANNDGLSRSTPLRSVHAAADRVRRILGRADEADARPRQRTDVVVHLLPGEHNVGPGGLVLGAVDGGRGDGIVTWRSADPARPASLTAKVAVTGWRPHPSKPDALLAPLPQNIS